MQSDLLVAFPASFLIDAVGECAVAGPSAGEFAVGGRGAREIAAGMDGEGVEAQAGSGARGRMVKEGWKQDGLDSEEAIGLELSTQGEFRGMWKG